MSLAFIVFAEHDFKVGLLEKLRRGRDMVYWALYQKFLCLIQSWCMDMMGPPPSWQKNISLSGESHLISWRVRPSCTCPVRDNLRWRSLLHKLILYQKFEWTQFLPTSRVIEFTPFYRFELKVIVNFLQAFENCRGRDTTVADGTNSRHRTSQMLLMLNDFTQKLKLFTKVSSVMPMVMLMKEIWDLYLWYSIFVSRTGHLC